MTSMVHLDSFHRGLSELISSVVFPDINPTRLDEKLADLDGVSYHISTPTSKTQIVISMQCPCFKQLLIYGAQDILVREYGSLLMSIPEQNYDVSLQLDLERLPSRQESEKIIFQIANLKRNVLAAPFEKAFDAQAKGNETQTMAINYRDEEAIYLKALPDRVTVVFSTTFKDETDRTFGKVFLQEFVDARRQQAIQNAPQVLYNSKEAPLEVKSLNLRESENVGYVTFVLFPRHFSSAVAREECISKIQLFRDYFHYHIKCSKAYMHTRMRARVDSFMKVLNRAKHEKLDDAKEKKTVSGKTFKRN